MKKWFLATLLITVTTFSVQMALAEKMSHKEYATTAISDCNSCHKSEGVAPNHEGDWVRGHRVLASKAGSNCSQCHDQSFCLDCHSGGGIDRDLSTRNYHNDYVPKSHRSNFLSLHPVKALDNPQSCNRCHDASYCSECHSRFPKGSLRIKSHLMLGPNHQKYAPALFEHATEARRNLQSCQACHPDGDVCVQCHSAKLGGTNPHPRNWGSISDNYRDRAGSKVCTKCHLPGTY
ncbi:cytochrome c [Geotalea uraniireducens]|uniref:Cytochrome c n=1 Tax=Geotalea uraniireducens TaxID=351604 RepID=A0ABM8EMZ2_9BACT|nr:cytochrome C [Geotalea uraniireducens]BDV41923.1 cytochrome c [Geotalea uraniireducens]BDV43943.1 cytochrome c [Geotalea uraniireducens]BDV43948.1 cytochrome c [Geotalea uraniireducens]